MRLVFHHRTQGQGVESVHLLGMATAFERAGARVEIVSPPGVTVGRAGAAPSKEKGLRGFWWVLAERVPEFFFELLEIGYNVPAQNYHAHVPYASLRFYFGRAEQ